MCVSTVLFLSQCLSVSFPLVFVVDFVKMSRTSFVLVIWVTWLWPQWTAFWMCDLNNCFGYLVIVWTELTMCVSWDASIQELSFSLSLSFCLPPSLFISLPLLACSLSLSLSVSQLLPSIIQYLNSKKKKKRQHFNYLTTRMHDDVDTYTWQVKFNACTYTHVHTGKAPTPDPHQSC